MVVPVAVMVVVEPLLVVFVVVWLLVVVWWCSGCGGVSVAGDGSVVVVAEVETVFVRVVVVKVVGALL